VPIRDELIRVLRWLPSRKHDGEVFLDHKGKLVTPERASERLKVAAVKAEIPDARKLRFHDLRHTCATNLLNSGVPVHAVKAWLGHAKLETTDRYSHAGLNDLRRHAAKLDGTNAAQAAEPTGS
jgi:site-specific recombinase XerD